jgi:hypothetical protein
MISFAQPIITLVRSIFSVKLLESVLPTVATDSSVEVGTICSIFSTSSKSHESLLTALNVIFQVGVAEFVITPISGTLTEKFTVFCSQLFICIS